MKIQLFLGALSMMCMGYSQRTCGVEAYMKEHLKKTSVKLEYQARQQQFQEHLEHLKTSNRRLFTQTYIIPVAVHFPDGNESDRACLQQLAQSQIDVLNADYSATNSDLSNWDSAKTQYPGVTVGNCNLKFVIATQNHPANTDPDVVEGQPAVTIGYNFGNGNDSDAKWSGYMNFIVKDIGEDLLGYSVLGGSPNSGDSVVMNTFAFGTQGNGCSGYTPSAPYDLGRTVTHELGHHYNLNHTWGTQNTCVVVDGVADTPAIDSANYGCPSAGSVIKCDNKALTMNFMDYVNDACMYMFTEGQANVVMAYMDTISASYNQNTLSVDVVNLSDAFVVYPNPAHNAITITTTSNSIQNNAEVHIIDLFGKVIKSTTLTNTLEDKTIHVEDLENGVYLLKVTSGALSALKKIVIH